MLVNNVNAIKYIDRQIMLICQGIHEINKIYIEGGIE